MEVIDILWGKVWPSSLPFVHEKIAQKALGLVSYTHVDSMDMQVEEEEGGVEGGEMPDWMYKAQMEDVAYRKMMDLSCIIY